jgi:hypothetical protein
MIPDQCGIKQFHKLDVMNEEIAKVPGFNHAQIRYVQTAIPGGRARGYSEALIGADGDWGDQGSGVTTRTGRHRESLTIPDVDCEREEPTKER